MGSFVLGISAFYHDSAACLLRDGEILAAAEEERFSRRKGDERFPARAIEYCLAEAGIRPGDLSAVAYYDKPIQTFGRLLQSYLEYPLRSYSSFKRSLPVWVNEKLRIPRLIDRALEGFEREIYFCRHHESHAASAFFASPFREAALVVVDGVGEWACTSIGEGSGNRVRLLREVRFPHSLGLFYSAMTQYLGFRVNFDEYKVMGLAPYGTPVHLGRIREHLVELKQDGSLALNLDYFDFPFGLSMVNRRLARLFGREARGSADPLEQFHMDLAASVQALTTEAMIRTARTARRVTGHRKLCMAGGVALNCVANGAIYRAGIFDDVYIQPAAGDAGGAIGAALQVWHQVMDRDRSPEPRDLMRGACLGPAIDRDRARAYLERVGAAYRELSEEQLAPQVARWIAAGHVIGFAHGRMEFGPRALGARSILADPRAPDAQSRINLKVKYRESFRPFAPAVLEERVEEFFDLHIPSPYMLLVMPIKKERRRAELENAARGGIDKLRVVRSDVPAVTHVDYSVRVQTATSARNPILHRIIAEFALLTGCPMVVNTSFNVRGEPIVCDHEDAHRCFLMTDLDILVLDRLVVAKPGVDLAAPPRGPVPGAAA